MGILAFVIAFTLILATIITYFVAQWFKYYFCLFRKLSKLPSLEGHPIYGNLEQIAGKMFATRDIPLYRFAFRAANTILEQIRSNKVTTVWLTWVPYIVITHPDATEAVLSSSKLLRKADEYVYFEPWIGTGLLTSANEKWKKRRKMLTPTFHFKILEDFQTIFDKHSRELIEKIRSSKTGIINVFHYVPLATLDVICETAMGVSLDAQKDPTSDFVKAVTFTSESIFTRFIDLKSWFDVIFYQTELGKQYRQSVDLMHKFSLDVINKRKKELWEERKSGRRLLNDDQKTDDDIFLGSKRKKIAFMDLLIENHFDSIQPDGSTDFTIDDIREEVDTFMFEGFETTATAVAFTLYLLGLHDEYQEKAYTEVMDVFGADKERPITVDDLKRLKYVECCVKEALRLYPSVPLIARKTGEDINVCEYVIPKGSTVLLYLYGLHRDPEAFPDPETFDPSRFFPENSAKRHPYAYVPFSAGPRNCIGQRFALMEVKTMVANILRHFRLESFKKMDEVDICVEIIIKCKEPLEVAFIPRQD